MELLVASRLSVLRSGAAAEHLFAGVDLRLAEGDRVGLVGANGSGKSTLLRLLAHKATPDDGAVVRTPGTRTALLDQDAGRNLLESVTQARFPSQRTTPTVWQVAATALAEVERVESGLRRLEVELARGGTAAPTGQASAYDTLLREHDRLGGYAATARLREILAALGFGPQRYDDLVVELSDGERQRLAVAAVVASPVDVLLLDEPTNHLDIAARGWLERHLSKRHGATVLVSHDRALLDAATNRTAFLSTTGIAVVNTSYSRAAKSRAATESQLTRRMRDMEREAARLAQVAEELAAHGAKAHARRQRAARDSSALRARARQLAPGLQPGGSVRLATQGRSLAAGAGRTGAARQVTRGLLVAAEHLTVSGVLDDVAVRVDAGDRIALLGPNGSGKSTLVELLAGGLSGEDPRQRLWYAPAMKLVMVDQRTRGLEPGVAVLAQGSARLGLENARNVLAATGLPYPAWSRPPEELSGGERARVGLALAMAQPCDLLLLDEPDNDLDLAAVEALESGLDAKLQETGAALVIATHDRRLARAVADRVWTIENGALVAHGSVAAYLRGETAVPAATFWQDTRPHPVAQESRTDQPVADQLDLEAERDTILDQLSDPLALGDREQQRLTHRLRDVESALMSAYEATLTPAAPRYRLVERGLTVYADLLYSADEDRAAGTGHDVVDKLLLVAAADAQEAAALLVAGQTATAEAPLDVPWLDIRLVDDLAHMRLGSLPGACLLPTTAHALIDAGTRLAFTVMGAGRVQIFSHDDLGPTMLAHVRDSWWGVTLARFLTVEGWSPAEGAAVSTRAAGRARPGRRRRRKVVSR